MAGYRQTLDPSKYFYAGSNSPAPHNLEIDMEVKSEVNMGLSLEEFKKSVIEEYNSIKGSLTKEILFFEKYKKIPLDYGKNNIIELMYS